MIEKLTEVLRGDPRVQGLWLAGSRGRGDHDKYSDYDFWVVVDDVDGFLADWPALCDRITPTVLRQRVGRAPVFTQVTPEWVRFDISVSGEVGERSGGGLVVLFEQGWLGERLSTAPAVEPSAGAAFALTTEFLRMLGLLPMIVYRGDGVLAASGSTLVRRTLIDLMLLELPAERGGASRTYALLPVEHRAALERLPAIIATPTSAIAVQMACYTAFLPLARRLCGPDFPAELLTACAAHLNRELDLRLDI